jgi:hypothetical protein
VPIDKKNVLQFAVQDISQLTYMQLTLRKAPLTCAFIEETAGAAVTGQGARASPFPDPPCDLI